MTHEQWKQFEEYFNPFEGVDDFGDPLKMDYTFVETLFNFRAFTNRPLIVTYGTQGKHVPGSAHYAGKAVDGYLLMKDDDAPIDAVLMASRFKFTGIGLYPEWTGFVVRAGKTYKNAVGIHLQLTDHVWGNPGQTRGYWVGYYKHDKQHYRGLDASSIKEYDLAKKFEDKWIPEHS